MAYRGISSYRMPGRRKTKYGNRKVELDGFTFDSVHESNRYAELKLMLLAGEIEDLKLQYPFELQPSFTDCEGNKVLPITYKADFVYTDKKTGKMVVEDAKSEATKKDKVYRLKKKMMAYKGVIIREV